MGKSQSKETIETGDDTEDEKTLLSLLLMGKTGHGKSALGNCILGRRTFTFSNNTSSQIAEVASAYSDFESFSLKVVDGPGLEDTKLSKLEDLQRAVRNMGKALTMCSEGVDAFLFVFRFGVRFTEEEVSALETLKAIFGKDYLKHVIVVLTYGDQFDTEGITFDDWCKKQTGPFRELYDACDGRCVLFNNKETNEEKQIAQREQLTQLAYDLKKRHGCYTDKCFKLAASERQRVITNMKQPILKEEIQRQAGILSSKIENYGKKPSGMLRAEIERVIRKLKKEIKAEDKGRGLLKDLMKTVEDVERNLDDTVELQRLYTRLENLNKAVFFNKWTHLVFGPIGLLYWFIIDRLRHTTQTKIKDLKAKLQTSYPASNGT